ncbi:MAG: chemotaxis protein CheW, partial [Termitinemataceae bacterium]
VSEEVIDVLLGAIDIIKAMLAERMNGSVYSGNSKPIEQKLSALLPAESAKKYGVGKAGSSASSMAGEQKVVSPAAAAASNITAGIARTGKSGLSEYELLELRQAAHDGNTVYRIVVTFNEDNVMNTVGGIQVFAALKGISTVLRTVPDFEQLYEDIFHPVVEYFVSSNHSADELKRVVSIPDVTINAEIENLGSAGSGPVSPTSVAVSAVSKSAQSTTPAAQEKSETSVTEPAKGALKIHEHRTDQVTEHQSAGEESKTESDSEGKKASKDAGSILRVDSKRIDNLLNLVSETVITKATFNQISNQFGELMSQLQGTEVLYREKMKDLFDRLPEYLESIQKGRTVKEIKKEITERYGDIFTLFDPIETGLKSTIGKYRSTAQNLGRITGELQEGVMRIRMVPISQIFNRFPRLVRDLSKSLNKKINLIIEGEETELDKSVIEDLLDPIMHSVRNCIDHGIEAPEVRLAAGKNETGTVLLKASNEGNMIIIEIADDGKGIDVEAVRAKAIERGLIHPNKELTDVEAFNLIFEPGFSTAKEITNISGRGVGLDVVRRQVEKLNGSVTVTSERGKGTRFIIKLPLTLAIIQGLLVRVGREIYSIPITSVIESHRIRPSEIKMIDNYEVFNIRNDVISLLRLNRLFGIKTDEQREFNFVVIVGTAEKKVGLMVDSLIGEEDVVIKPLRDQFTNSPGIAGASILGDGSVSLIIDVSQLLELGLRKELEERRRREASVR